jgi:pimeloyl-ACP methyl ester carboxylesterase
VTLVLIDPVISRFSSTAGNISRTPAASSLYRREIWPSREEAEKSFDTSPFYKAWDPRVLDAWKKWGISDSGEGKVALTTTKAQECATFFRPSWDAYDKQGKELLHPDLVPDLDPSLNETYPTWPVYRAEGAAILAMLPHIRPPLLYIVGGQSGTSAPEIRKLRLDVTGTGAGGSGGVARGRVQEIAFEDKGHLLPMEIPTLCAEKAAPWIGKEVERWKGENEEYKDWTTKSLEKKTTLGEEWYEYVPRRLKKPEASSSNGQSKI